jgi:hypothetical protein
MRHASRGYQRRAPESGVLYKVLQDHLDTFLVEANAADSGAGGVPMFVQKELRSYLSCGVLSRGFARFRCSDCNFERLVALSCKGRGVCPSCGGKRMTSLAAELTDRVIPFVPVRQFVLSLPHRQRYRLAYDHSRSIAVLRIFIRTVMSFYRRRGLKRGVRNGRTGSVTFLQRFGSAANCNLHFHVVMLDGVFAEDAHGELFFHAAEPPTEAELEKLVDTVRTRVLRHLDRQGIGTAITAIPIRSAPRPQSWRAAMQARSLADIHWVGAEGRGCSASAPIPMHRGPAHADRFKCSSKASTCTLRALSQRNTVRIASDSRRCCDTARDRRSPTSACALMWTGT